MDISEDIVTRNFSGMSFAPRFSPEGNSIVFSLTQKGSTNIYIQNLNSKKLIPVTRNKHINTSPSFSPDNQWLVFSSDRAGKQNLYIKKMTNIILFIIFFLQRFVLIYHNQ